MTQAPAVTVAIDDRARLLSAALAATNFPQLAQDRMRHHAHAHARQTARFLHDANLKQHPAVLGLQGLLEAGAVTLDALFGAVLQWSFPGLQATALPTWMPAGWNEQLWDFYEQSNLEAFWHENRKPWDDAHAQALRALREVRFREFLASFLGDISETFVFMPNICYPADVEVAARSGGQLLAIVPPPLAWGESPPWPYDEETNLVHSYRASLLAYGRLLLRAYLRKHADKVSEASQKELPISDQMRANLPHWEEQFIAVFNSASVAIYLEDYVSANEAKGYSMLERKTRGMDILPATISVLRRYMQERGHKYSELADFLGVFPSQLRVAKRIVTM